MFRKSIKKIAQKRNATQKEKDTGENSKEMQKRMTQRLVNNLMLDDATAAKVTPLYEAYMKELQDCMPERKAPESDEVKEKAPEPPKELTDSEIESQMKARFNNERKALDVREKYYAQFSKILTQKQVMKVFQHTQGRRGSMHDARPMMGKERVDKVTS